MKQRENVMVERERVIITGISRAPGKAAAQYFRHQGNFVIGVDENEAKEAVIDAFHRSFIANSIYYLDQLILLSEINNVSLLIPTIAEELVEISFNRNSFLRKGVHIYISPAFSIKLCEDHSSLFRFLKKRKLDFAEVMLSSNDEITDLKLSALKDFKFSPLRGRLLQAQTNRFEHIEDFGMNEIDRFFNVNICIDGKNNHEILASKVLEISYRDNQSFVNKIENRGIEEFAKQVVKALDLAGIVNVSIKPLPESSTILLSVDPKIGDFTGHAIEVFDAFCWMWYRDLGKTTDFFIPGLPANWNTQ